MFNKKHRNKIIIYITTILLITVIVLTRSGNVIKDAFNMFEEKIFFVKEKNIIIKDSAIDAYINTLKEEINELKGLNKIGYDDYKCINASVIYRDPSYWYDTLTINKGIKDGINKGNMVVTDSGLIGSIKESLDNTSVIHLLTNSNSKNKITVGIKYENNMIYGLISDYDLSKDEITVSQITSDIKYQDNMDVITTGFTNTFIEGILVGNVKRIEDDSNGLSKNAVVKPSADFNNIKYVCVMVNK